MLPEPCRRLIGSASSICRILTAVLLFCFVPARELALPAKNAPLSASPAEPFDTVSFVHELGRLKSELETARKSPAGLHVFRDSLPEVWAVRAGEQQYEVPTSPLASRLTQAEKEPAVRELQLNQARDFLDALAAETTSLSGLPPSEPSSAQAILARILARPEFANRRQQSWWDRFRERINEMISDALLRLLSRIGGQKSMGQILLWIGVCAAAILIAYWIFRRWFRAARLEEIALQSSGVPVRSWQKWVHSSRAAAGQGDYRMAIHCAYWAGIARLEEIGALPADRAKTPREYLLTLTKAKLLVSETHATRYQALSMLTSRLENIWYGYHIATETDFRDSLAQLEILGCHLP
jgi:hypothetical protein